MKEKPLKKLMKPREAANYLGIHPQTLYLNRKEGGSIPFLKVGGVYRYEKDQLDLYIKTIRVNPL